MEQKRPGLPKALKFFSNRLPGIGNTIWACATLCKPPEWSSFQLELAGCVAGTVGIRGLSEFSSQSVANVSWAFAICCRAVSSSLSTVVVAAVSEVVKERAREFQLKELASTVWALAAMGIRSVDVDSIAICGDSF